MTTQCKVDAPSDDKTGRLVRRDSSVLGRRPGPASYNPLPVGRARNEFTVEEHLLVQRKIEERAHRIWTANVRSPQSMLDNWLKAEREVLAEFVESLSKCNPTEPEPNKQQKSGRPLNLLPEIRCQQANRLD